LEAATRTRPAILDLLRERTRAAHDRAEEALPLLDPSLDAARYRAILAGFWGFHAALEPCLAAVAELRALGLDPAERRKLPRLEHDLRTLGADPMRLPVANAVPEVEGAAAALGCMYVLEGATLGGRVISRHLAARGIGPDTGGAFFAGYGRTLEPHEHRQLSVLAAMHAMATVAWADEHADLQFAAAGRRALRRVLG